MNVLSGSDFANVNGSQIDASQLASCSFHGYFGDSQAAGTLKAQASNDTYELIQPSGTVVNWVDIPSATATISAGSSGLVSIANNAYRWLRAVWTTTGVGTQTVAPIADTGVAEVSRCVCVADVAGSLNSKYFLISSVNPTTKVQKNFYVWYNVDSGGVDPAIAGKTGIAVAISAGDANTVVATATGAAIAAVSTDFASSSVVSATVTTTNTKPGNVTNIADGTAATGFTFSTPTAGVNSNLNNTYFYLQDTSNAHLYYVWMNIASIGTDPAVAGRTGVAIAVNAAASAGTIGAAIATAVAALNATNSFTATGTTTVTITNKVAGPFVAITDVGLTGFTFAVTAGGTSTVKVNFNAVGF